MLSTDQSFNVLTLQFSSHVNLSWDLSSPLNEMRMCVADYVQSSVNYFTPKEGFLLPLNGQLLRACRMYKQLRNLVLGLWEGNSYGLDLPNAMSSLRLTILIEIKRIVNNVGSFHQYKANVANTLYYLPHIQTKQMHCCLPQKCLYTNFKWKKTKH